MVIDHANRLHEGINDCRATEFKPTFLKIFRHLSGQIRKGWNLRQGGPRILDRTAPNIVPKIAIKALLLLDALPHARVADGGGYLAAMADNPRILQ